MSLVLRDAGNGLDLVLVFKFAQSVCASVFESACECKCVSVWVCECSSVSSNLLDFVSVYIEARHLPVVLRDKICVCECPS